MNAKNQNDEKYMNNIINQLIQLQEMIDARAQKQASHANAHLSSLDESIDSMMSTLPADTRLTFQKLLNRSHLAITAVHNGCCASCGIMLPVSLLPVVKAGVQLQQCPSCARILFHPLHPLPKQEKRQKTSKYAPQKVGIARFSSPNLMIPDLRADGKEDAIRKLCVQMKEAGFFPQPEMILDAAMRREAIISTAVEHGIAFPHVRGIEGGGLTLALGACSKGFKFDEDAKRLTRLVFFIVIPTAASAFYLTLLSGLSETLQKKENREKLLAAGDSETLWKELTKITRRTIV